MMRRWLGAWLVSTCVLACGDDGSTEDEDTSEGSSTTGSIDPDTLDGTTPIPGTGDSGESSDGGTTDPSTTTAVDSSSTGPGSECGNGVIEGAEVCDGADLGGEDCVSQGGGEGTLACAADCTGFDTSRCVVDECGSNLATGTEVCDGTDLLGETCITQGFDGGTLSCQGDCAAFDTSACGTCGNVIIDGEEACDGVALLGQTCVSQGFEYGEIACAADCASFDTAGCGVCGDGSVGGEEQCDGADLGGATCLSIGLLGGVLGCQPTCTFDISGCETPPVEVVDFPLPSDPRFTATGIDLPWNAGDWFEGVRMTSLASIGQIDIHLEIVDNGLTACGVQEAEVSINGVALGTFAVVQGTTVIDQSFPVVPSIAGPQFTIRYETTATVAGGCGAAGYDQVGSTVTFYAG